MTCYTFWYISHIYLVIYFKCWSKHTKAHCLRRLWKNYSFFPGIECHQMSSNLHLLVRFCACGGQFYTTHVCGNHMLSMCISILAVFLKVLVLFLFVCCFDIKQLDHCLISFKHKTYTFASTLIISGEKTVSVFFLPE